MSSFGTLEYWRDRAEGLGHENAELRNQADRAWNIANLTAKAGISRGVLIDEEGLGEHFLGVRAFDHFAHGQANLLEGFRRNVIATLHDAEDAILDGADAGQVLGVVGKAIRSANARAKLATMAEARESARKELLDARFGDLQLFRAGGEA